MAKIWHFFPPRRFFPTKFVYICSESTLHISGFYFMRLQFLRLALATHERRVPDSLCSPLIRCRMQGKKTDYCKVRIEATNFFPAKIVHRFRRDSVEPVSITSV